jgi:hypothetical protein
MNEPKANQTVEQALQQQREVHGMIVPADKARLMTGASPVANYLAEYGVGTGGINIKFSKNGEYVRSVDGEVIREGTELVCIYDQTQAGFIKFMGKGEQPERRMGPIFAGYMPPRREELGDQHETEWETDLSGKPADPWQHQMLLPLQDSETGQLYIFGTTSITGRRAIGNLLQQCERLGRKEPDMYPVIKLGIGGFQHRDDRVGWVKTPVFPIIGKAPRTDTAAAQTSVADQLSDEIPW